MPGRNLFIWTGCLLLLGALGVTSPPAQEEWVERTLAGMSLEQKVGQVLVGGAATRFTNVTSVRFHDIRENITRFHLGGYHAFRGDVLSAALLIRRMQELAPIPLLITADLEGGAGLIFQGATRFPKAMALAATDDLELVEQVARITAREGKAIGVSVNFYPVVDVNINPENPIISIRSFGDDPQRVAAFATAYMRGIQEEGLLATAKHFPGHGDTAQDSHLELPVVEAPLERLQKVELFPFREVVRAGVGAVMTAHLFVPALEPEPNLPATLSRRILTDLLRREMGFEGLLFTDAMTMGGVTQRFGPGEAAVRALLAGADVILYPPDLEATYLGILQAVRSGELPLSRLEEAVRRVLAAKARLGLPRSAPVELEKLDLLVGSQEHQELAQQVMERAVTLLHDSAGNIPLSLAPDQELLLLTFFDRRPSLDTRGDGLLRALRERHAKILQVEVGPDTSPRELRLIRALAARTDVVLAAAYVRVAAYQGSVGLPHDQLALLRDLSTGRRPLVLLILGSPYLALQLDPLPSCLLTFDDYEGAELAAVKTLFGEIPAAGKLPVRLPGSAARDTPPTSSP